VCSSDLPLIVAELPDKEKYLIDGYARWRWENKYIGRTVGSSPEKYDAVFIQAKDLDHVKELYLQCQSRYGTANHTDFSELDTIFGTPDKNGYSRYETGLIPPRFNLSVMTREEIAETMLKTKYQIL
jgi:hypothetical protein